MIIYVFAGERNGEMIFIKNIDSVSNLMLTTELKDALCFHSRSDINDLYLKYHLRHEGFVIMTVSCNEDLTGRYLIGRMTKCDLVKEIVKIRPNAKVSRLWDRKKENLEKLLEKLKGR